MKKLAVILSLLAKSPDARPGSGEAVAQALREEAERERSRPASSAPTVVAPAPAAVIDAVGSEGPTVAAPAFIPAPAPALASPAAMPLKTARVGSTVADGMLDEVLEQPLILDADERYLCGHYLAYLLGGSRRQGWFLRPLSEHPRPRARRGRTRDACRRSLRVA